MQGRLFNTTSGGLNECRWCLFIQSTVINKYITYMCKESLFTFRGRKLVLQDSQERRTTVKGVVVIYITQSLTATLKLEPEA